MEPLFSDIFHCEVSAISEDATNYTVECFNKTFSISKASLSLMLFKYFLRYGYYGVVYDDGEAFGGRLCTNNSSEEIVYSTSNDSIHDLMLDMAMFTFNKSKEAFLSNI